jgi:hypothetical protein
MLFSRGRKKNDIKIHRINQPIKGFSDLCQVLERKKLFNGKNDLFSTCGIQNQKVY